MTRRIHVVGVSPRTGTTLMYELIVACYRLDGASRHEMSIFEEPTTDAALFCSKRPKDLEVVAPLLRFDRGLWVVNMVRDPRDVVVSRHRNDPSAYWVHLGVWKRRHRIATRLAGHPRVVEVRYEDLVHDPDGTQERLESRMPFLERTARFSEFHDRATPSEGAEAALGGTRPIDTSSIGNWRHHKPRLAAQLALHGPLDEALRAYGYETDDAWKRELDGVVPDDGRTHLRPRASAVTRTRRRLGTLRATLGYLWRLRVSGSHRTR